MKKSIILILALAATLSSCVIAINENNYRFLTETERQSIKPFSLEGWDRTVDHGKALDVCEINSRDILTLAKQHSYTWVHVWNPTCKGDLCQNISFFETLANRYADQGLMLVMVSQDYNLEDIQKVAVQSRFNHPIGILENAFFGYKNKKARLKLFYDLTGMDPAGISDKNMLHWDDFLFEDDKLVLGANEVGIQQLDSLILR